jgi:DNA-binding transcriptional LysR family regulator
LKLTSQLIGDDALVLIVAPSHPLAGKKKVSLRQLSAEPLIVREPGSGTRRCVEQVLEAAGVSPGKLNIVMEINSNEAIRAAVSRGLGGAFQSRRAVEADIASGRFVPVTVTGLRPVRQLYLVTDPKRLPSAAMRAFLALVERWTAAQN